MNIILCDDEQKVLFQMKEYMEEYFADRHIGIRIRCFTDANDILEDELSHGDILFIDVYMPNSNGIEFVKKHRDSIRCQVVFVTMSTDHAIDAFNVDSRHYVLKPIKKNDIEEALDRCMKYLKKNEENGDRCIKVKTASGTMPVPFGSICYIDIVNTKVTIHTDKFPVTTYSALGDIFDKLDSRLFLKANRSYIVNMDYISAFYANHVVLKDGLEVSLSRKNHKALREKYHNYLVEKVRERDI